MGLAKLKAEKGVSLDIGGCRLTSGVNTAWIQPDGITIASPLRRVMTSAPSNFSGNSGLSFSPERVHAWYMAKFRGVGGATTNILRPHKT